MAQEHLNSLLTEAGFEPTDIEAILALQNPASDAAPEVIEASKKAMEPYISKLFTNSETKVKNDPKFWEALDEANVNEGFKKKIEAQQFGRAANIVRQKALKGLGLAEADMADLPEEDKNKLEVFIQKAAEKYATTKAGDKELQKQLVDARKKIEDLELDIPTKEEKFKQDFTKQFNEEKFSFLVLSELAGIEGLKAPAQYLVDKLASQLKEEAHFDITGMKASPKQKDKPTLDILEGSKALTLKDLIVKKLTSEGLIEDADTKKRKGETKKVDIIPEDGELKMSGHIAAKIAESQK